MEEDAYAFVQSTLTPKIILRGILCYETAVVQSVIPEENNYLEGFYVHYKQGHMEHKNHGKDFSFRSNFIYSHVL